MGVVVEFDGIFEDGVVCVGGDDDLLVVFDVCG